MSYRKIALLVGLIVATIPSGSWTFGTPTVVNDAVGLRITEAGLDFVERQLADTDIYMAPEDFAKFDVLCYDEIGIRNPIIDSFLDQAVLEFHGPSTYPTGSLEIGIYLPSLEIFGQLYGEDDDFFDLCPSFAATIEEFRVDGIVFTADTTIWVDDNYYLHVDFVDLPEISFSDMSVDFDNFSDTIEDLVFSSDFVQGFILDNLNELLQQKVPELLRETAMQAMFQGEAGTWEYFVGVGDIRMDDGGASVALDVGLASLEPSHPCVPFIEPPYYASQGELQLGEHGDLSMLELSVSDAILNQALYEAWRIGTLCYDEAEKPLVLFESLLGGLESSPGEVLKYTVVVKQPPTIAFKPNGAIYLQIKDFSLVAHSNFAGEGDKLLFDIEADLTASAILTHDGGTNQVLLSIDALSADFSRLQSEVLYSDNPNAEEDLKNFIVGYVIPRMQHSFSDVPVSDTIIYAADYVLLFDFIEIVQGHALTGLTIFEFDDPAIDKIAPDTHFTYTPPALIFSTESTITFDGTDNQGGDLVFSYKLDDAAWSPWKRDKVAQLPALFEGTHSIQVKARDSFLNEDSTPAVVNFKVEAQGSRGPPGNTFGGCACSLDRPSESKHSGTAAAFLAAALVTALTIRRRRRRS